MHAVIRLKPKAERRLKAGHLWVYSNEVDTQATPLKTMPEGCQAIVEAANGKPLGVAVVSPKQLICARLFSRDIKTELNGSLIVHRLKVAAGGRDMWFDKPYYRLVYGDSDGLPGLVIDRFANVFVVQISTMAMELLKDDIVAALNKVFKAETIVMKNDGKLRQVEGLPEYVEIVQGALVDNMAMVEENGVPCWAPVIEGQKTGWFYDHRMNRAELQKVVKGKRVLDVFSYVGGWGIQAAAAGAAEVHCSDASAKALDFVELNAELNGVQDKVVTWEGDAFQCLRQLRDNRETFDVVVVDPPAFIPRRKDIKEGEQAYRRINQLAMRLLAKDGLLVSASCSMHLAEDSLQDIIRSVARETDRDATIVAQGHQGPDHPVLPAIPETRYLKSMFVRVLPTS